jgi:hypothetical protein
MSLKDFIFRPRSPIACRYTYLLMYGAKFFLLVNFRNKIIFYGEELLAPRPTLKLEDHPLSAVHDCLFNIFAATLHIWRPFPPSATWGRAMPWWHGNHSLVGIWFKNNLRREAKAIKQEWKMWNAYKILKLKLEWRIHPVWLSTDNFDTGATGCWHR